MDHEPEIRFVEAHAQCRRGDERLDSVGEQVGLGCPPLGIVGLSGVARDRETAPAQERRRVVRSRDGERVDDSGSVQRADVIREPGEAVARGRQRYDAEAKRLPVERAAEHQRFRVATRPIGVVARTAGVQLLGDIGRHPRVRRRGRRQHRRARRQLGEQRTQPAVVRPEIVAPVGDAVRLVHDQQTGGRRELRQHIVTEVGVVQALRADQQDIDVAGMDLGHDRVPVLQIGRVDRAGVHAGPRRRIDLVAHQREQRRDDDRRAGTARSQQRGCDEVDGRLPPSGPLHA
jgi:hypothetical protein